MLFCTAMTSALIMLDTNIVAVALPTIARDLHAGFTGIQWIISAYLVTFAAFLLPAGSLADLHGRRRIVLCGLGLFLVSSAACGLATSVLALELARAVQGVGGSLLLTSALAIIASTFAGAERVKAYAFWGTCLGVAITFGPIVGGIITGVFGWRWAFLINVPLCSVFLFAIATFVPESSDPEANHFDWLGVSTLTAGLFALILALIDGNHAGWKSTTSLLRVGVAVVLLTAFVFAEASQTRPMLDLTLFRRRMFLGTACGMFGYGASAQVMIFFLPLYLQGAFGLPPLVAGFAMLPFGMPLLIAPRVAAVTIGGWSHRRALALGLAITAVGNVLLASVAHRHSYPALAVAMFVAGIGTGILNPETAKAMQAQVPSDRAGMASGIAATARFVSLLVGVAVLGAVMESAEHASYGLGGIDVTGGFATVALLAAVLACGSLVASATLMKAPKLGTVLAKEAVEGASPKS